ncbi:MAG: SusC/RagA family TonB-linked outer membrane protein, partial [Bacteroidota bacterium]
MKKLSLILALVFAVTSIALAQRTVTGTITDNAGEALIGASVLVKGTSSGTVTDVDGNYKVSVPEGGNTLIVSYTGFETQELELGASNVVDVIMSEGVTLGDVVVTALGVEREEKALGYSVQQVDGGDIARSGATSAVDAMVGKASGVQITRSSGSAGGGSRILIRGVTSMVGDNQPLIVIDGIRTNNETLLSQAETAGTAASNRLMDLNPEDIESVNVLKGAAATALYGTAGSRGVIVVTTKKGGQDQFNVNFTSSIDVASITQMIDLQNTYAQGTSGIYLGPETGYFGSWGPKMSDLEYATDRQYYDDNIRPFYNSLYGNTRDYTALAFGEGQDYRYDRNGYLVAAGEGSGTPANVYDNVDPFFQTALTYNNALSISGGGKTATFRLSASDLDQQGIVPNEAYNRTTVRLSSSVQPVDELTISGSINYTKSTYTRVQQGSNTSGLLLGMLRTPSSFDNANGLDPDEAANTPSVYQFQDNLAQRNYRGGGGYDNPYWIINNVLGTEDVNRVFGNIKTDYSVDEWLNFGLNIGYDITTDIRKQDFEIGSRTNVGGTVLHNEFNTQLFDNIFSIYGSGNLNDRLSLSYTVGANAVSFNNHEVQTRGDGLSFHGFLDLSNATQITGFEDINRYRQLGFFGQTEIGFDNMLYLTLSGRQDYDSRLGNPANFKLEDTQFFYPSVSAAFAFSELLPSNDVLSLGKVRLSWAQ